MDIPDARWSERPRHESGLAFPAYASCEPLLPQTAGRMCSEGNEYVKMSDRRAERRALRGLRFRRNRRRANRSSVTPMQTLNGKMIKKASFLVFIALLGAIPPAGAESDKEIQERALKARELGQHGGMDHSAHAGDETTGRFRGVFYGYLPCQEENCDGLKMTLSLNDKDRYLLVIQPAKPQNRESFEKGKYQWDDKNGIVVLTPNKEAPPRRLAIKDEGTLIYLASDGKPLPGDPDRYRLERSDKAGNREMHIH
ncbi:copper resistance protein NlpE [Methylococcus capsulatus]|nr:copper resistance protein NlpE [Methylococcus capsulatus]QXP87365.1 copper resistance protein NlpE [Methylococcus capsulatus]QXP92894.1 copper resistance protein NlpE [Methylococcus capsulatus]UQN12366.1 copper resistance protein NlpE [Methylococcus capsulatus]